MADEAYTICKRCRERLDSAYPEVVFAVEHLRLDGFGETEYVEGSGAYFHEGCYPERPMQYGRESKP